MIEIKRWTDGKVLYVAESAADVRSAVEEAVKAEADLGYADLRYADLGYANLRSANLRSANLGSADLGYADLGYANLRSADLRSADLRSADLGSADLGSADLGYADLGYANLRSADLGYADLGYADLGYADLGSADLRSADLGSADLGYADLGSADLGYADLGSADLGYADLGSADPIPYSHPFWPFWADFCSVLDAAPSEVAGLHRALVDGKVDGSTYSGACACLVGTIAKVREIDVEDLDIPQDSSRPAEQWFMPIREGDGALDDIEKAKAENEGVFRASMAVAWIDGWLTSRQLVGAALAKAAA